MTSIQVRAVIQALERHVAQNMVALALQIIANLVASPARGGTPVDTGWARANWIPKIGQEPQSVSGSRDAVTTTDQAKGQGELLKYTLNQGSIYISNNVYYITRLNAGSSRQAPAGYVQDAIKRGVFTIFRGQAKITVIQ